MSRNAQPVNALINMVRVLKYIFPFISKMSAIFRLQLDYFGVRLFFRIYVKLSSRKNNFLTFGMLTGNC